MIQKMKQKLIDDDRTDNRVDPPLLTLRNEFTECVEAVIADDIFRMFFETIIGGCRFSVEKELNLEENISLMREPDNAKDPNAIWLCFICALLLP
ncbi:hypothetical protein OIU85_010965 [Salix viminalis]|uniref:Uncharacterized protein n=1 Tax=Salix viminalis TaxID=40686 RepID=A0A9Q0SFB8_SALVM|nr:hypothetical protein OIU85_010965 [Salix viminalis]